MTHATEIAMPDPVLLATFQNAGELDPARCVTAALAVLAAHVAPGMAASSITLDLSPAPADGSQAVRLVPNVDKATRTVAFTSVEARTDAGLAVFTVRVLYALRRRQELAAT